MCLKAAPEWPQFTVWLKDIKEESVVSSIREAMEMFLIHSCVYCASPKPSNISANVKSVMKIKQLFAITVALALMFMADQLF